MSFVSWPSRGKYRKLVRRSPKYHLTIFNYLTVWPRRGGSIEILMCLCSLCLLMWRREKRSGAMCDGGYDGGSG